MKFTLTEAEIKAAIGNYVKDFVKGEVISIDIKATRGNDGNTAEVDLALPGDKPQEPKQVVQDTPIKREVVEQSKVEPTPEPEAPEPDEQDADGVEQPKPQGRSLFNINKE